MGADIISILFFITAIVLAFIRKINIGIVALALAVPCTMLIGLPGKEIIAGVNGNLFITLVGITLLFSIVNDTGALGLLAHKIVAVAGRRLWLIPILLFIAFKGYKVKAPEQMKRDEEGTKSFTTRQWISFGGIIAMLALIIFAKVNVGLAALIVSAVLLLCHIADDGKCIKSVLWGTILMVLGVGALLHIVAKTGGELPS